MPPSLADHAYGHCVAVLGPGEAAASAAATHAEVCEACGGRRRAMVSGRQLVARRPLETAPATVVGVTRSNRFRGFQSPPPLERDRNRRLVAAASAATAAVLLIGL